MKALIATGLGVLILGGVLVANSGRSASAQSALGGGLVSPAEASRTTLVNCGEGRQALVYIDPHSGASQVQCVGLDASVVSGATVPGVAGVMPVSQLAPAIVPPVQPAVVYRDPVAAPATRAASSTVRRTAGYRTASTNRVAYYPTSQTRSWKKSALIIGGSTAAAAGVGAIMGGKSGAVKGGVLGLVGGTVYDIATRNKK